LSPTQSSLIFFFSFEGLWLWPGKKLSNRFDLLHLQILRTDSRNTFPLDKILMFKTNKTQGQRTLVYMKLATPRSKITREPQMKEVPEVEEVAGGGGCGVDVVDAGGGGTGEVAQGPAVVP